MSVTAMWAIGIVLSVLLSIIGFLVVFSFNQLKSAFQDVLLEIKNIRETLSTHNTDLIRILSRNDVQSQFIDAHTEEIDIIKKTLLEIQLNCAIKNHAKK
jgi:predicted PurR-regulated permease PerM